jgi:DNA-binding winged helix-turn-helix (wHTH) protein
LRKNGGQITIGAMEQVVESHYPLTFRKEDADALGKHLKNRHSVVLIGMKRVGISNFLRFFLYHQDISATYIDDDNKHVFIPVDLNDLVEREIFPFWRLTLKRIVDAADGLPVNASTKEEIESLFLTSIQSQDLFFTIDSVRRALVKLIDAGFIPSIFFIRFDRMKDAVTPELFANLQGLKDATHQKLAYVFTSSRSLDSIAPVVFTRASLSTFSNDLYVKPADREDIKTIFQTYHANYKLALESALSDTFFDNVDGYVQYLHLGLIFLHEEKKTITTKVELFDGLVNDERVSLQSEELWESLSKDEQEVLIKISKGEQVDKAERKTASYLWDTGFVVEKNGKRTLFSPLFGFYLKQKENREKDSSAEFTKKEHLLHKLLEENMDQICDREKIIEAVWPEVEALGVSDWAIDRLVARVRNKLKQQQSRHSIQTVRTRGYKLVTTH